MGGLIYLGAAYRARRTLGFFLRRSFRLAEELDVAHRAAEQLARTDVLTGMNNRRAFYELRAGRAGLPAGQALRASLRGDTALYQAKDAGRDRVARREPHPRP